MIYGACGPYGHVWVARGEKNNVGNVKIIISDRDFLLRLCLGDDPSISHPGGACKMDMCSDRASAPR